MSEVYQYLLSVPFSHIKNYEYLYGFLSTLNFKHNYPEPLPEKDHDCILIYDQLVMDDYGNFNPALGNNIRNIDTHNIVGVFALFNYKTIMELIPVKYPDNKTAFIDMIRFIVELVILRILSNDLPPYLLSNMKFRLNVKITDQIVRRLSDIEFMYNNKGSFCLQNSPDKFMEHVFNLMNKNPQKYSIVHQIESGN